MEKKNLQLNDVKDLQDGVLLIQIYEIITHLKAGRYIQQPRNDIQRLENINLALTLFKEDGVMVDVGADAVMKGNNKLILGLLWSLIRRYQLGSSMAMSNIVQLLQEEIKNHADLITLSGKLQDDVRDGILISIMVNNRKPGSIDLASISKVSIFRRIGDAHSLQDNAIQNLEKAMDIAHKDLNIPRLILPSEIFESNIEDQSLITYMSYFLGGPSEGPRNPSATVRTLRNFKTFRRGTLKDLEAPAPASNSFTSMKELSEAKSEIVDLRKKLTDIGEKQSQWEKEKVEYNCQILSLHERITPSHDEEHQKLNDFILKLETELEMKRRDSTELDELIHRHTMQIKTAQEVYVKDLAKAVNLDGQRGQVEKEIRTLRSNSLRIKMDEAAMAGFQKSLDQNSHEEEMCEISKENHGTFIKDLQKKVTDIESRRDENEAQVTLLQKKLDEAIRVKEDAKGLYKLRFLEEKIKLLEAEDQVRMLKAQVLLKTAPSNGEDSSNEGMCIRCGGPSTAATSSELKRMNGVLTSVIGQLEKEKSESNKIRSRLFFYKTKVKDLQRQQSAASQAS